MHLTRAGNRPVETYSALASAASMPNVRLGLTAARGKQRMRAKTDIAGVLTSRVMVVLPLFGLMQCDRTISDATGAQVATLFLTVGAAECIHTLLPHLFGTGFLLICAVALLTIAIPNETKLVVMLLFIGVKFIANGLMRFAKERGL